MTSHRVLIGLNYRPDPKSPEKRAEPGEIVDDVPAKVVEELVAQGVLEPVEDSP